MKINLVSFIHMIISTLAMTICHFLANKNLKFIDLTGPSLHAGLTLSIVIVNHIGMLDEEDQIIRTTDLYMVLFGYFIFIGLLNVGFLNHFIIRSVLWLIQSWTITVVRASFGESNLMFDLMRAVVMIPLCEGVFYISLRTKAQLFLSMKLMEQQQS